MQKTAIEWVRNPDGSPGFTFNPITGCLNHVNGMCKGGGFPCYAYRLAYGRLKERYKANDNIAIPLTGMDLVEVHKAYCDPFYPRFWPERLGELNPVYGQDHRAMLRGIFICDMSDLFGIGVPEEWTTKVMDRIKEFPYHRFYLLTKQPQNLVKFSPFPDNCWVGVTVARATKSSKTDYLSKAVHYLHDIEAKVKYISFEPLLEWWWQDGCLDLPGYLSEAGINWLIIGAQTKPYKPPKIEWVREIVEAADQVGIPVFQKDNLKPLLGDTLRQELP